MNKSMYDNNPDREARLGALEERVARQGRSLRSMLIMALLAALATPLLAGAGGDSLIAFEQGMLIRHSDFNHNFELLSDRIDDLGTTQAELVSNQVPSGTVAFFDLSSCPAGWDLFGALRGRVAKGVPNGGGRGTTHGSPLGDDAGIPVPVPLHSHEIAGTITVADGGMRIAVRN